jgi:hypothetical protein
MKQQFANVNDADYIQTSARLIEMVLESLGIRARVVEVNILDKFYEYYLELAVGTDLKQLEKHDRDLAMALASPTGKVYWQIPVPGKICVGLKVPKPPKEYFENLKFEEQIRRKNKSLRNSIVFAFFLLGELNYWIARKLLDKNETSSPEHTELFFRAIARIRAFNEKDGVVLVDRLKTAFKIDIVKAYKLQEELINAGVIRWWNKDDFKKTSIGKTHTGNIVWKNINKYKVPKEIETTEAAKVKEERKKGLLPKTIGDLY